jgi:membrane-bound lytic murein transglycosylase A
LPGDEEKLSRLMIAQDTGSAIVGPARGDIFIGSGNEAGRIAGAVNQPVSFTILMPNGADDS